MKKSFDQSISDLSLSEAHTIAPDTKTGDALQLMKDKGCSALLVVGDNQSLGLLSERDLLHKTFIENNHYLETAVSEIMQDDAMVFASSESLAACMLICAQKNIRDLPVSHDGDFKMMTNKDILKAIIDLFPNYVGDLGALTSRDTTTELIQQEDDDYFRGLQGTVFLTPLSMVISDNAVKMDVSASVAEVLQIMRIRQCSVIVLTEYDTTIRGVISESDIVAKILGIHYDLSSISASDFMTADPHRLTMGHFLSYAINNMFHFGYRNVLVVDKDDYPTATLTFVEIIRFLVLKFLNKSN